MINYDFLTDLENRGLAVTIIRVKNLVRNSTLSTNMYTSYASTLDFTNSNSTILNSNNYLCSAGDFPVIENLTITNNNFGFSNSWNWKNITSSKTYMMNIQYDNQRSSIYQAATERYTNLMLSLFDTYSTNVNNAISVRLNSYMDPCYVDAGYVSPNA